MLSCIEETVLSGELVVRISRCSEYGENFVPERADGKEPTDDVTGTHRADDGALANACYFAEENQGAQNGSQQQGAVHCHFHTAEAPIEGAAESQTETLGRERNHVGLHIGENPEG